MNLLGHGNLVYLKSNPQIGIHNLDGCFKSFFKTIFTYLRKSSNLTNICKVCSRLKSHFVRSALPDFQAAINFWFNWGVTPPKRWRMMRGHGKPGGMYVYFVSIVKKSTFLQMPSGNCSKGIPRGSMFHRSWFHRGVGRMGIFACPSIDQPDISFPKCRNWNRKFQWK